MACYDERLISSNCIHEPRLQLFLNRNLFQAYVEYFLHVRFLVSQHCGNCVANQRQFTGELRFPAKLGSRVKQITSPAC